MHVDDLKRLIRESGKTPVERDTLYRELRRETAAEPALV
jgi:2-iminoacetate synthase ThiH